MPSCGTCSSGCKKVLVPFEFNAIYVPLHFVLKKHLRSGLLHLHSITFCCICTLLYLRSITFVFAFHCVCVSLYVFHCIFIQWHVHTILQCNNYSYTVHSFPRAPPFTYIQLNRNMWFVFNNSILRAATITHHTEHSELNYKPASSV